MHYQQELFAQKTPYLQWLWEQEQQMKNIKAAGKRIYKLPFSSCTDSIPLTADIEAEAIYLFLKKGGTAAVYAVPVIENAFLEHEDAVLIYADEDYRGSLKELYGIEEGAFEEEITAPYRFEGAENYRGNPWFKPDFSPDTLASFFYIGSIFAVKGEAIRRVTEIYGRDISLYELVYRIFMEALHRMQTCRPESMAQKQNNSVIVHIPKVLYTNDRLDEESRLESAEEIKKLYAQEGVHADSWQSQELVSVIIPSKDHAQALCKCLDTLTKYTRFGNYELIIVDNGSNPDQRMCIERHMQKLRTEMTGVQMTYLYQQMDFNFSKMCNIGAGAAQGTYLLFLNDDVEVIATEEGGKWLEYMISYAAKRHVGAVGAKLYYPDGVTIQHAGITNMGIGPAHKLGGMADTACLYHGHNTMNYDMLAVTAACMLLRRSVFEEAGGFDEELAVAYNDVELCFRLYELGYFNVQVNTAALIHHESLSRGQDTTPQKRSRLNAEKQKLYKKHPLLKNTDPFYSPNLVQWKKDTQYHTNYLYECDKKTSPRLLGDKEKRLILKQYNFRMFLGRKCRILRKIYDRIKRYHLLQSHIDSVEEAEGMVVITGWYFERERDNARRCQKLWLIQENGKNVYEFEISPKLREDVASYACGKRTKNAALAGIQIIFEQTGLHQGSYSIGILADKKRLISIESADGGRTYVEIRKENGMEGVIQDGK